MDPLAQRIEQAHAVKQRHEIAWLQLAGVASVGVGFARPDEPAVVIGLKTADPALRTRFPAQIDGIPVMLVATGVIRAN